ncbi:MFS transporter [Nitratidesulfovibrio sp. HK-II]|uniref:MFS transporter n=1 Tax=Nitratidesulfovibrio sp. HK-II TaxID=2009266 RepID=UPI000E2E68A0|nr:MFS transporter [Nitratidesulfovibrio sp. HK-II]GBO96072.1 nitrate/nitrite transporter [Nitratidesulfovibrio sp. HK-II]
MTSDTTATSATATDTAPVFSAALPWVGLVALLFFVNYGSRAVLAPLLLSIETDLGLNHAQATRLLFLMACGFTVSLAASGFLLSRVAPRRMAAFSCMATGAVLMGMSAVHDHAAARYMFVLMGLAAGLYFPAGMATLGTLARQRDWGKAVSIHELGPNLSFVAVPLLAEAGLRFTDWRGVLAGMGALGMLAGITFACVGRGGRALAEPPSLRGFTGALRSPLTWLFAWLLGLGVAGEYATYSVLPLHLVESLGLAPGTANGLLAASRLVTPFAALAGGWVADRMGARRTIAACLGLTGVALLCMAAPSVALVTAGMTVQGGMTAFIFPAIFKELARCYPAARLPTVLSIATPASSLVGTGAAPALLGAIGQAWSFSAGFALLGVLALATIIPLRLLPPEPRR